MKTSILAPLFERFKYSPESVSNDEICNALEDYSILVSGLEDADIDTDSPETVASQIDEKLDTAKDKVFSEYPDYDNYKTFFDDCFERLNSYYPCPEVTSDHDCSVIFNAIQKGDTE